LSPWGALYGQTVSILKHMEEYEFVSRTILEPELANTQLILIVRLEVGERNS